MKIDKNFFCKMGYPQEWLTEAEIYSKNDSYVIYDPEWDEPIPEIPIISIYELFQNTVDKYPDRVVLSFLDKDVTYIELDMYIRKFSSYLIEAGVKKGDFIVTMLPPCTQHWIVFFASAMIGATCAPLNVMYKEKEIRYQINDCGARTVVTLDVFFPYFEKLKNEFDIRNIVVTNLKDFASPEFRIYPALKQLWSFPKKAVPGILDFMQILDKFNPSDKIVQIDPKNDSPLIIYTSGTTGETKGAIETHFNLVHNTITHSHLCRGHEGLPVNYSILPTNHTGGYMVFQLPMLYLGGRIVPRPIFDIEDCLKTIDKYKVNYLFGPPTFYQALMMYPKMNEYDLGSLKLCAAGAAPVSPKTIEAWKAKTGAPLVVGWGGTEMNTMGTFSVLKNKSNPFSVGLPYIGEVMIEKDDSPAPRGEVGEILYRGLQVSKGYLNKPIQTAESFLSNGWFKSGDAGYIDDQDFLHYVDRIKDLIIASGYNISPAEVEEVILSHPDVLEVGVIGVPDDYRGETVKAFVALKPDSLEKVNEEDIIIHCKQKIAAFKVPTQIQFLKKLPKNVLGKTLRRLLKDMEAHQ